MVSEEFCVDVVFSFSVVTNSSDSCVVISVCDVPTVCCVACVPVVCVGVPNGVFSQAVAQSNKQMDKMQDNSLFM